MGVCGSDSVFAHCGFGRLTKGDRKGFERVIRARFSDANAEDSDSSRFLE